MRQIAIVVGLCVLAAAAKAADAASEQPSDAGALSLADEAPAVKPTSQSWRLFGEGALGRSWLRNPSTSSGEGRASVDLRYDDTVMPRLRAVLSDRLDLIHRGGDVKPHEDNVNTLREAYLSWHATPELITDVGRINLRYGAAFGYNPTDYFKVNALRTIVSLDPASLRESRQGTFVLQGQKLWIDSSATVIFSPKLGRAPSDSTFAMNFGSTNPSNRWLLVAGHKFAQEINPQVLLYGGERMATQAGLNVSGLVNRATVAYLEYSAGRGLSLVTQADGLKDPERSQQRGAAGLTYTTDFNLSLTAEYEYNSAAPSRTEWKAMTANGPSGALRLLLLARAQQDLPVRQALFMYASWRDVGIRNLDLSAFVRHDAQSRSREQWIEARYHWSRTEIALQWQQYTGSSFSVYGLVPQSRRAEALFRVFL
ncbi:MAG: hypothetical protein ABIZ18_08705 [Caldimonas sp.]